MKCGYLIQIRNCNSNRGKCLKKSRILVTFYTFNCANLHCFIKFQPFLNDYSVLYNLKMLLFVIVFNLSMTKFSLQGTHHTITGLLFACKYRVTVAMKADPGSEAVAWVTTPTCSSVRVRGGRVLPCNTDGRELSEHAHEHTHTHCIQPHFDIKSCSGQD